MNPRDAGNPVLENRKERKFLLNTTLIVLSISVLSGCMVPIKRETPMSQKKSTSVPDSTLEAMEESIPKTVLKQFTSQPILRIGFMEGYEKIDFRVSGEFDITDPWVSEPLPESFQYPVQE